MRRFVALCAVAMILSLAVGTARSTTLERVRAAGLVRCGGVSRPGLAFPAVDDSWHGLEVDMCQAIAAATIGADARVEYHGYEQRRDFDRLGSGADDVAFLTTDELFANELFGTVLAGATVFQQTTGVMVPDTYPVRHVADLGRTVLCAEPGTAAERNLRSYAAIHVWDVNFSGWTEAEEMMDAYMAGRCPALVGEITALAALRLTTDPSGHASRILPEPLAVTPVMAASAATDAAWANIVTWTINTVLAASAPREATAAQLPISGAWLGLDRAWQARAVAASGSFADMYRRSLGRNSPLTLPLGVNASWRDGGLLVTPAVE